MEKNYLFIKENQEFFDFSNFNFSDIHLWNIAKIYNKKENQNIYFYCKNLNDFQYVVNSGFIPHLAFIGDSLFSDFYIETLSSEFDSLERFWFPEKKHLNEDFIRLFLSLPNIYTTALAIVFNPFIQSDISYPEFMDFVKKLHSVYKNPLYFKDLSLQDNEIFSLNNQAIIDGKSYFVVLGLFGDYYLSNPPSLQSINLGILKDSVCLTCEFAQTCKDRGLGIIKFEEKFKSCIGIKIFQQN